MFKLELSAEERTVLAEVLKAYLSDLSYEIADTDRQDFRDELKRKREHLSRILAALETDS